jgi:hypothetical protein
MTIGLRAGERGTHSTGPGLAQPGHGRLCPLLSREGQQQRVTGRAAGLVRPGGTGTLKRGATGGLDSDRNRVMLFASRRT